MSPYPPGLRLERAACPLGCTAGDVVVEVGRDRLHDLPGRFRVVRCRRCDLMRTDPRPTPETIGIYYPDDYGPYAMTQVTTRPERGPLGRLAARWLGFDPHAVPPLPAGRLLEVGCASGAFLSRMAAAGWDARGIEFSPTAAAAARAHGFEVHCGPLETAPTPDRPVDLVAAWMVLEHLHEPLDSLRRLHDWTRPGGWLAISVPDVGSWARRAFGPDWYAWSLPHHLFHYTHVTVRRLLRETGWQVRRTTWHPNPDNLLHSLRYRAQDGGHRLAAAALTRALSGRPLPVKLARLALGRVLGAARATGRLHVVARRVGSRRR